MSGEYVPDCGHCLACATHHMAAPEYGGTFQVPQSHMWLCPTCGNKRCPHATDHRLACTASNAPNQPGSQYQQRYFGDEVRDG